MDRSVKSASVALADPAVWKTPASWVLALAPAGRVTVPIVVHVVPSVLYEPK
jgi:hypothetical protein